MKGWGGETYRESGGISACVSRNGGEEGGVKEEGRTSKIEVPESCGGKVELEGLVLWIYCCPVRNSHSPWDETG